MGRATGSGTAQARGADPAAPGARAGTTLGRTAGAATLVAIAVVAAALAGPWDPETGPSGSPLQLDPPPVQPTVAPSEDPLWEVLRDRPRGEVWDLTAVGLVLAALVAGLIGFLVLRLLMRLAEGRRGEGAPDPADLEAGGVVAGGDAGPHLPALREGVEDAGAELRRVVQPVDAVIAAWVTLENAAAGSGVVRRPAQTPTEFTVAVLDRTPVDPSAVRTLLGLYLKARFGDEPVSAADVDEATEAVRRLAAGLAEPGVDP